MWDIITHFHSSHPWFQMAGDGYTRHVCTSLHIIANSQTGLTNLEPHRAVLCKKL